MKRNVRHYSYDVTGRSVFTGDVIYTRHNKRVTVTDIDDHLHKYAERLHTGGIIVSFDNIIDLDEKEVHHMDIMTINDLPVTSSYTVYDRDTGHHVFTWFDTEKYGDIPPDIAFLPVDGLRTEGGILCIDTHTGNTAP